MHLSKLLRHSFFEKTFLKINFGEKNPSLWSPTNHCVVCSDLQWMRNENILPEPLNCKSRAGWWQCLPSPAPGPRCISPFKNQNCGSVSGLAPSQARSCAWQGRSSWTVPLEQGLSAWGSSVLGCSTAKNWFKRDPFTSGSQSYRAADCLKLSAKFIFNFLWFPNSKGKGMCSVSDLEGRNCSTRKSSCPQEHRYQWIIATERHNRWPNTWDAGLPLFLWP